MKFRDLISKLHFFSIRSGQICIIVTLLLLIYAAYGMTRPVWLGTFMGLNGVFEGMIFLFSLVFLGISYLFSKATLKNTRHILLFAGISTSVITFYHILNPPLMDGNYASAGNENFIVTAAVSCMLLILSAVSYILQIPTTRIFK